MAPKSRTLEEMDAGWKHGKCVDPNNRRKVQCNYCGKKMDGGVTRLKQHLGGIAGNVAPCPEVPFEIKREMLLLVEGKKKDKIIADRRKQLIEEELTRTAHRVDSSSEEDETDDFAALRRDLRESRRSHAAGEWGRRYSVGDRETGSSRGPTLGDRSKSVAYREEEVRNMPEIRGRSRDPSVLRKQGALQPKIKGALKGIKNAKNQVGRFIAKFFIYNNIPFNAASSPHYQPMIDTIASCGSGVKGPTPYEISNTYLDMEINDIDEYLKSFHRYWDEYGCTIMCDGWSTQNRRCIINFLVYSPQGTIFLKSVDASDKYKDSKYIFGLMNEVVEQIGEKRVVQIITDNGSNYKAAGLKLMEVRRNLYWTPCAAHCIDLMLKDIANDAHIKPLIQKSQDLTCFIYNHGWALSIMRTETQNGELVRPAITRFATNFLALDSILKHQTDLKRMTNTRGWTENYMKLNRKDREKANVVVSLIDSQTYWRDIAGVTAIFGPLVKVLRMVDSDDKAEMGHLYEAMDRAKEMIKKNVGKGYRKWWKMIDHRWNSQLHRDIHAAGYFLNPKYQYSNEAVNDDEVLNGFHRVVNRMVDDNTTRLSINREAERFRLRTGVFNSDQFKSAVNRCLPAEWWSIHAREEAPNLTRLAVRILSQTVSSSNCERNWTTFSLIHTRPRNRLTMARLEKLVFVHYNMRLRVQNLQRSQEEQSVIDLDEVFHEQDPLTAWTRERETPLLDGRENEWLDDHLDVDPQDTAENVRRPEKRKKTPYVQSRQVESDKDDSTDSGGNGATLGAGADNLNEYQSPTDQSQEHSEGYPSDYHHGDYHPGEYRIDDVYAGGSRQYDVDAPSDNYNMYNSSSTGYYPYNTPETEATEPHSTYDGLMTSFFDNTDISHYYPHNPEQYRDNFDSYEPFE